MGPTSKGRGGEREKWREERKVHRREEKSEGEIRWKRRVGKGREETSMIQ